jgi:hypothetical protein
MAETKDNKILELIAIIAIALLLWKIFRKKTQVTVEPATTPAEFEDQGLTCQNIYYKPLSPWGPFPDKLLGSNWCYRGDGTYLGDKVNYGNKYADEQALAYADMKQTEAIRDINRNVIQFRLINSTGSKATATLLDINQDVNIFDGTYEGGGPAPPSPPAPPVTFTDWFLPSRNTLDEMYLNLKSFGVGGFGDVSYWSSTETNATTACSEFFGDGTINGNTNKSNARYVRAARSFISASIYALRDTGPAGGLIFYIVNNGDGTYTYYEAAATDTSISQTWSNIINGLIGTTSPLIGQGNNNTLAIIAQAGHTNSAAKICYDLIV